MVEATFRSRGGKFTGIESFKDKLSGKKAVICCSGTTLREYNDASIPEDWVRFAVNEGIRKLSGSADFWVLSDKAIVYEYADLCKSHTTVLAMHQAASYIDKYTQVPEVYTMNSMPLPPALYDNGYEFFSRGTVMIGAVEMARYMGIKEFYIFGLDCYRTENEYYYDGRTPEATSERNPVKLKSGWQRKNWDYKDGILVSPRLQRMIEVLEIIKSSGFWDDIKVYCVNSPMSQQKSIPPMTLEELSDIIKSASSKSPEKKFPTLVERGIEYLKEEEDSEDTEQEGKEDDEGLPTSSS